MERCRRFEIDRRDLRRGRWVEAPLPPLADGALRVAVERFALTANNVTYAAFGESMRYWEFFPTGDAATGCVPVWGFATVLASNAAGIDAGTRLYGFWPMAEAVDLQPARADAAGFLDASAHRRELHAVYNHYRICSADPGWRADREAQQAILQPLFTTSFLIDDFLADQGFFGATQVVLSSASSKTAVGTAFCLARRGGVDVVGLTSDAHRGFCTALGVYGRVLGYDEIGALDPQRATVYVDMSGSAPLRAALHRHFGERLVHSSAVGGTHWSELAAGRAEPLPGARPQLFFAPAQARRRIADWGGAGFAQRLADAWGAFMGPVCDAARPWLHVVDARGPDAIAAAWAAVVDGRTDPHDGVYAGF